MVESGASWNFEPWIEEDVCSGRGHILHSLYVSISLSLNLITLMYFFLGCGQREEKTRSEGDGHNCCFRRDVVHEGTIWLSAHSSKFG
jgi:hypothetical protein